MNQHNRPDPLDQVLLTEDTLLPSSGFADSIMDRIDVEACAPAPIPFPWKRAIPGFAALPAILYFLYRFASAVAVESGRSSSAASDWLTWLQSNSQAAVILRTQAAPAVLAIIGAWLCVVLCLRLAGGWSMR